MAHVLVTGGVRSGKSRYAESRLPADAPVTYLTPGYPADGSDAEWTRRVRAHQAERPSAWQTVESLDLAAELGRATGPVLIDCLGTWLARLLDSWDAWEADESDWADRLAAATAVLAAAISSHPHDVVVVSNEVGWGLVSEHRSGRLFADHLGRVNQAVAAACDEVFLLVAGRPLSL